jgi:hypothetical protein
VTIYDHVAVVQRVAIPLGNMCHALVLFEKEKLCSIAKEIHKFLIYQGWFIFWLS